MRTLVGLIVALSCGSIALGDGFIRDGLGARSAGRGGTNIAWNDNGVLLHDNPGGVINSVCDSLVECDLELLITDIDYRDPDGVGIYDSNPVPLGNGTFIKKLSPNVAGGFGIYTTGGFASDWDMPGPFPFFGTQNYKSFGAYGRLLPGLSFRLTDRLSMGGTLGVAIFHAELEGPHTLQTGPLRGTPTRIDLQGTGTTLSWSWGMQYIVNDRTTIGATYQSETRFDIDGGITAAIPGVGVSAYDLNLDMTWPRSLGVGARHEFCPDKIGSVDVIYYNWQKAFDHAGMMLTNPSNPVFAGFGSIQEQFPLRWRDTLSVRFGFERLLCNDRKVRFGYVYHRNPIPAETLTPYMTPILEHTVSVGYGNKIPGWEVDYGYQFMFSDTVHVGTSDFVGGDFDNSQTNTQAHFLFISFLRRN